MTIAWFLLSAALSQAPIAIQGAVDTELGPLIEAIGNPQPVDIQGFRFWEGEIDDTRVVVSRTEVGMVHAAMATTILIREYAPRIIINQGTAGAVNPELVRGDIILGKASVPFGAFRTSQRKRDEGVDIERWVVLPRLLREGDERVRFESFATDADLLARASEVPYTGGKLLPGILGSADQWNREIDKLLWAHKVFGIDSEDMETAAVHQVAHISGIPILAVRIISNSEYHDQEFRPELGSDCAEFVIAVVKALAQ
ncbi:MAG: 5'-methylthioadenosine/S-adenosylhomocysteine nucleosidase [Acidobacteriota bacterium]|nr:MAG: 5'-methylthioadenosine/S-adenosylhomocysteine nucleosidase [Acidobacteriota bacterium]